MRDGSSGAGAETLDARTHLLRRIRCIIASKLMSVPLRFLFFFTVAAIIAAGCGSKSGTPSQPQGGDDAGSETEEAGGGDDANLGMGGPGCGLPAAAFCDTFDAPSKTQGRAGELNPKWWSVGRVAPQGPTGHAGVFPVGEAMIPGCRAGIPMQVFPDQDTLVCDPTADVNSNYLLTACASQNYGSNSYRVRQPFDFAGRTGKIVFDGAVTPYGGLFGWLSLEVTEDPIAAPSYETFLNVEGGVRPRNAFEVQFDASCGGSGSEATGVGMSGIHVFTNYMDAPVTPPAPAMCPSYQAGKMNHFEVLVSQTNIEVHVSPLSADGVKFDPPAFVYQTPVNIPFSRGYVHVTLHNHATLKYSGMFGVTNPVDASVGLWDNVGFDGPIVTTWREYEVPDALVPVTGYQVVNDPAPNPYNPTGNAVSTGYLAPDVAMGPAATLHLAGVDPSNAKSARLELTAWYLTTGANAQYTLTYRFNGGTWRDYPLSADEASLLTGPPGIQGALGHSIDVPLTDLVAGDNTLEFVTKNVPQNYPPAVANVDLVLATP